VRDVDYGMEVSFKLQKKLEFASM